MQEPGPRPSRGPGWRPGRGLSPGRGTFSENRPAARPGPGGTCPRPWTRAGVGKVTAGARNGLGVAQMGWVSLPRVGPAGSPAPSTDSNLPPGPRARRPERAPGRARGKCNFLPGPAGAAPGRLAAGRPRRAGGRPGAGAGCGAAPRRGRVRAAKFSAREGRLANFAELSPPVGRPPARAAPAPPAEGGRGSPSAPSPRPGGRRLPPDRGSPRGFAPRDRRGCCLPGRWIARRSGWRFGRWSSPAVAS